MLLVLKKKKKICLPVQETQETRILITGKIPWSRTWQPVPLFLPEKFHGQKSLVDYGPWGCEELDATKRLSALLAYS